MFNYLGDFCAALIRHRLWWWVSLGLAYVVGVGIFADYSILRAWVNARQDWVALPAEFPLWLVVLPLLIWLTASSVHRDVIRHRVAPRLSFDHPDVAHDVPLYGTKFKNGKWVRSEVGRFDIAKTRVRNNPVNKENGKKAEKAFTNIEFYRPCEPRPLLTLEYARWTDNPKPGYVDSPSFSDPVRFRDIEPNNAPNAIDIAIKYSDDENCFAFTASSADKDIFWKEPELMLDGRKFHVRVIVDATGMGGAAEEWFILRNHGKGGSMDICLKSSEDWKNWVGIG